MVNESVYNLVKQKDWKKYICSLISRVNNCGWWILYIWYSLSRFLVWFIWICLFIYLFLFMYMCQFKLYKNKIDYKGEVEHAGNIRMFECKSSTVRKLYAGFSWILQFFRLIRNLTQMIKLIVNLRDVDHIFTSPLEFSLLLIFFSYQLTVQKMMCIFFHPQKNPTVIFKS